MPLAVLQHPLICDEQLGGQPFAPGAVAVTYKGVPPHNPRGAVAHLKGFADTLEGVPSHSPRGAAGCKALFGAGPTLLNVVKPLNG